MTNPKSNVMPLRILLNLDHYFLNPTEQIYNSKGELLFVFKEHHYSQLKKTVEFTDALFEELISISDIEQAKEFIQRNPEYTFAYPDTRTRQFCHRIGKQDVVTKEQLWLIMIVEIDHFHYAWDLYSALLSSQQNRLNSQLALEAFLKFIIHFDIFGFNDIDNSTLDFYSPYELSLIDEPQITLTVPEEYSDTEVTFSTTKTLNLSFCIRYLNDSLAQETSDVTIRQCFDDLAFEFHCPTLLSAMYEKMLIGEFNKDTYLKCDVCSNYFKVDKSHPQTRCDIHMRSRRKKRQNARAKEKTAIATENRALEESMNH
jgi:hypothetical protein